MHTFLFINGRRKSGFIILFAVLYALLWGAAFMVYLKHPDSTALQASTTLIGYLFSFLFGYSDDATLLSSMLFFAVTFLPLVFLAIGTASAEKGQKTGRITGLIVYSVFGAVLIFFSMLCYYAAIMAELPFRGVLPFVCLFAVAVCGIVYLSVCHISNTRILCVIVALLLVLSIVFMFITAVPYAGYISKSKRYNDRLQALEKELNELPKTSTFETRRKELQEEVQQFRDERSEALYNEKDNRTLAMAQYLPLYLSNTLMLAGLFFATRPSERVMQGRPRFETSEEKQKKRHSAFYALAVSLLLFGVLLLVAAWSGFAWNDMMEGYPIHYENGYFRYDYTLGMSLKSFRSAYEMYGGNGFGNYLTYHSATLTVFGVLDVLAAMIWLIALYDRTHAKLEGRLHPLYKFPFVLLIAFSIPMMAIAITVLAVAANNGIDEKLLDLRYAYEYNGGNYYTYVFFSGTAMIVFGAINIVVGSLALAFGKPICAKTAELCAKAWASLKGSGTSVAAPAAWRASATERPRVSERKAPLPHRAVTPPRKPRTSEPGAAEDEWIETPAKITPPPRKPRTSEPSAAEDEWIETPAKTAAPPRKPRTSEPDAAEDEWIEIPAKTAAPPRKPRTSGPDAAEDEWIDAPDRPDAEKPQKIELTAEQIASGDPQQTVNLTLTFEQFKQISELLAKSQTEQAETETPKTDEGS